ncbi:MAG: LON peptidase substrate-binding domain-containing protein [Candidatus Latescibacteria bacterium]|nr:LON peptidase substrate-binding domain-containing protein [Candidatus Latescibacterota bacterium]
MEATVEIPLFPLNVVLFPGMPLPLHIFEERYKQMIGDCLTSRNPFGVLLATQTQLANVGCTAAITQIIQRYADGRLDILTEGRRRFRVLDYHQRKPYLEGAIEYFDDEEEDVPNELLERAIAFYQEMTELATKGLGRAQGIFDPVQFSFMIASTVDRGLEEKQTLLEFTSTTERLLKLIVALEQSLERLRLDRQLEQAAKRNGRVQQKSRDE